MAGEKVIDFSVLEGMNLPKIEVSPKDEVKVEGFAEDALEAARENAIDTVEGIESFIKPKDTSEEGKEKEGTTESETSTEEPPTQGDDSAVKVFANWAKEQNLIEFEPDTFEDTQDWLKNKIEEKVQKGIQDGVEARLKEYPEEIHELAKNYKEGVPLEELIYSKSRETEFSNIKEDDLEKDKDLQKHLVKEWIQVSDPDATEEEVNKKVQKYEDAVLLEDMAKEAHKKLIKYEQRYQENLKQEAKKQTEERKQKFDEYLKNMEKEVTGTEEFIPGIKTTLDERKKILNAYIKQDAKGETALMKAIKNDPKAWYKITQFMVLMNGNLESIKKNFQTEAAKKVKETVSSGGGSNSSKGITDLDIKKLKKIFKN